MCIMPSAISPSSMSKKPHMSAPAMLMPQKFVLMMPAMLKCRLDQVAALSPVQWAA
jgi:hypothetical protein